MSILTLRMRKRSRYLIVAEDLESRILHMGQNSLLETEQQLAKRCQVSRVTVRRALSILERTGLISRERGRGTIVNPPKVTRRLLPLSTIEQDLRDQGLKLETRLCEWQPSIQPPDQIRSCLHLNPHESVAFLSMIRTVDDRIICHDQRYFRLPAGKEFDIEQIFDASVSHLIQQLWDQRTDSYTWEMEFTAASWDTANALGVLPGTIIFVNRFTHYFNNCDPVETGIMSYRIDRVKFKVVATGSLQETRRV